MKTNSKSQNQNQVFDFKNLSKLVFAYLVEKLDDCREWIVNNGVVY